MIYFSTLQGKPILDLNGRNVGSLMDFTIAYDGKNNAEIDSFVTKINGERRKIPQSFVLKFDKQIHLNVPFAKIPIIKDDETTLSLVNNILDMQIVDIEGMKVVRVNDIMLSVKENKFCVTSVDVGFKGFLRRLGAANIDNMPFANRVKEKIIPWEFVAPLEINKRKIQLNIPKTKLSKLHPADLADIMEDLSHRERAMIFRSLDEDFAAKTLVEAEPEVQKSAFKTLRPEKIADIMEEMLPEQAADIISIMPKRTASEILGLISPLEAEDIKEIMAYGKETAGGLMSTNYIAISEESTVDEVIQYLRDVSPDSHNIYYIYVVGKDNVLKGVLSLRNLIVSKGGEIIENIMFKNIISVSVKAKKEDIANLISKYNLLALPVINIKGQLEGIIRSDLVLELVMPKNWKTNKFMKKRKQIKLKENTTNTASSDKPVKNAVDKKIIKRKKSDISKKKGSKK